MIGRKVRGHRSLTAYIALVYGVATLTLIVIVLVGRQPMFGFSPAAYGWTLVLGLVPQLVGHSTLNWALRHLSATFVAIVTLAEPIGSGLLAYLVLGEAVPLSTLVGGIVLLAGIYIASRAELRPRVPKEATMIKTRCFKCGNAFQLTEQYVANDLAAQGVTGKPAHYTAECPQCRQAIKIPLKRVRLPAPEEVAEEEAAE